MGRVGLLQSMLATNASTILKSTTLLSNNKFFQLHYDVISSDDETLLFQYLDPIFRRKKYQGKHWDSVIAHYKEVELETVPTNVSELLSRLRATIRVMLRDHDIAFIPPHALDLDKGGSISPHVDSVKFSGDLIAGLSLCSTRILRLSAAPQEFKRAGDSPATTLDSAGARVIDEHELYLPPRSLYLLRGPLRYDYCHAILGKGDESDALPVISEEILDRRISVMFRNEAPKF